jgi:hypothetical protein
LSRLSSDITTRQSTRKSTIEDIEALSIDLALFSESLVGSCHAKEIEDGENVVRNERMVSMLKRVLGLPEYLAIDEVVKRIEEMRGVESIAIPVFEELERWEKPKDGSEEVLEDLKKLDITVCSGVYAKLENSEKEFDVYNRLQRDVQNQ